ncbi:MAG: hypothetical protein LBG94_01290 [Treponema sp.]|jgi:hypothetical protein|nr:hypothetical protein [Treponema sp.]
MNTEFMKRAISIILLIFLMIAPEVFGQEFTFRGHRWGASVEDIIAIEGTPSSNNHGRLIYNNIFIAGYNAILVFNCFPTLIDGEYNIYVSNINKMAVYNDLLVRLKILYGNPASVPSDAPAGIIGQIEFVTCWIISRTVIRIEMINWGSETQIRISYISPQSGLNDFWEF